VTHGAVPKLCSTKVWRRRWHLANVPVLKKVDGVILTGCTISQIERKAEMSATGQERKSWLARVNSALPVDPGHWSTHMVCPLRAKSCREQLQRRAVLFDHLIGASKQRRGHYDAGAAQAGIRGWIGSSTGNSAGSGPLGKGRTVYKMRRPLPPKTAHFAWQSAGPLTGHEQT
jgi:hypothetical protein